MKKHIILINVILYVLKLSIFILVDELCDRSDIALVSALVCLGVLLIYDSLYMIHNKHTSGWKVSLTYTGMVVAEAIMIYILMKQGLKGIY